MVRRGPAEIAVAVSFAAVPGAAIRGASARPPATRAPPTIGATMSGSVSGGRLPLESLPRLVKKLKLQKRRGFIHSHA